MTEQIIVYVYECPECGCRWRQENFFEKETCIACGVTANYKGKDLADAPPKSAFRRE